MSSAHPTTHRPSYASGYATSAAESAYPRLWYGLQGAWMPCLGPTGLSNIPDVSGKKRHGTPTGVVWDTAGGHSARFDTVSSDIVLLGRVQEIISNFNATFVLHYEKTDTTNRGSCAFGSDASGASTAALRAFVPYSDGTVYWDFGGASGTKRITASGLTFGNDVWIFAAGPQGLSFYQNGVLRASNTTAASLGNDPIAILRLGTASEFGSDLARVRAFLVYDRQLTEEEKQIISHDPVAPFRLKQPTVFVASAGSTDLEHEISHSLSLVQTASQNMARNLSVSSTLAFTDEASRETAGSAAASELELTGTVEHQLLTGNIQVVEDELGLTDSATGDNADVEGSEHSLNLTQSVSVLGPIYRSVQSILSLQQQALGTKGVPWLPIEIEHELGLTDQINIAVPLSVSDAIVFVQEAFNRYTASNSLGLTQTAVGGKAADAPEQDLNLQQAVLVNATFLRSLSHSNILKQSLTYFIDSPCARKQYNRYQGEGDGDGIEEKPLLFRSNFVLESLSGPKQTVTLRSPEMDDRDRLGFNRINRETRGGELNIYADPTWPKINTLLVTIIALKHTTIEELQDFMLATLGQQIKLQDWQGRSWIGVITTPGDVATEDEPSDCGAWTMSFEFEGEPVDGQYIDDRIAFEQDVLPVGPVEQDMDGHGLALNQTVVAVVETP